MEGLGRSGSDYKDLERQMNPTEAMPLWFGWRIVAIVGRGIVAGIRRSLIIVRWLITLTASHQTTHHRFALSFGKLFIGDFRIV